MKGNRFTENLRHEYFRTMAFPLYGRPSCIKEVYVCMYVCTLKSGDIMSRSGMQQQDTPEVIWYGSPLEFLERFLQRHSVLGNLQVHVYLQTYISRH